MSNTVLLNFSCPPTLIELYVAEDLFLQRENGHFYFCWEKKTKKKQKQKLFSFQSWRVICSF